MEIYLDFLILIIGFALVIQGANFLVEGATALAHKYHISEVAIGLSVIAFGTSAPELVVNLISSARGESDLVFANVIGSNIFNLYMVLGIVGMIYPMFVKQQTVWREIPFSIFIALLFFFFVNDQMFFDARTNELVWYEGLILFGLFLVFMIYVFVSAKEMREVIHVEYKEMKVWKMIAFMVGGIVALLLGGKLVVDKAVVLAEYFEVSKKMIALVILAPATSLPELATSVVATFKKRMDLAVGNIVGSNVFNVLLVLASSSFLGKLTYDYELNFDIYFYFFGTLLLFVSMFTGKVKKLARWESGIFFLFFVGYIYFLFVRR